MKLVRLVLQSLKTNTTLTDSPILLPMFEPNDTPLPQQAHSTI
jgi:hypothetical protein